MSLHTEPKTLSAIWNALNAPAPPSVSLAKTWAAVAREGWISELALEDAMLMADRRLDRFDLRPDVFVKMLKLEFRPVFDRPANRFDQPDGYDSLSVTDAAAVLILLERLGFLIDAEVLCSRLRSELSKASHLTWQGVDALFHHKSVGRTPPLTLDVDLGDWRGVKRQTLETPHGYKAEYALNDDEAPLWLTVKAPKYRPRPEPTLVICEDCGHEYVKGIPSADKQHRRTHRRRLAILKPEPDRKMAEAVAADALEAPWVDSRSPQWKHDHMYRRAFAFKREFDYTFSQWPERPEQDPDPVGFLFIDPEDRVAGSAAFRPQPGEGRPWRLDWIWLAPDFRRQGHLARHWDLFRQRFGEFDVEPPVSDAMKAFLRKRGLDHLLGE
ncbi:MAG: GNAT family N-acetyltransferase [Caulobacteraceae bacterium]|nr:GNAT family N-acetyltransferase [Caulobacteraceae bacterium]